MRLKILTPDRIFLDREGITRLVLETLDGKLGLLARRLDGVAPVAPGMLTWETADGRRDAVAVDEGILVKQGEEVLVSVRHAVAATGTESGSLREAVTGQIEAMRESDGGIRKALALMESRFIRQWHEGRDRG